MENDPKHMPSRIIEHVNTTEANALRAKDMIAKLTALAETEPQSRVFALLEGIFSNAKNPALEGSTILLIHSQLLYTKADSDEILAVNLLDLNYPQTLPMLNSLLAQAASAYQLSGCAGPIDPAEPKNENPN